jgi:hypothetical protein
MKKAKSQASAIRDFLIAAEESGVSLPEIVAATGCCPVNASTLLSNWMKSGNVSRTGFRGSYRYFYTGEEFVFKIHKGKTKKPNDSYARIVRAVVSFNGSWFCSVDICQISDVKTSVVCNFLRRLVGRGALMKRGKGRFEYRQLKEITEYFAKAKISAFVYDVFCFPGGAYSVDEVTDIVVVALSTEKKMVIRRNVKNSVRSVVERWHRDGFLEVVSQEEDPPLFRARMELEARPLNVAG